MKIETYVIDECTLAEFADRHDLVLEMRERPAEFRTKGVARWYCSFKDVWIRGQGVVSSPSGNAETQEAAMDDYARQLSERKIVLDIHRDDYIQVPRLIPG